MSGKSESSAPAPTCVTPPPSQPSIGQSLSRVLLYVADQRHLDVAPQNDVLGERDGLERDDGPRLDSVQTLATVGTDKRSFDPDTLLPVHFAHSNYTHNADENNRNPYREIESVAACNPSMPNYIYRQGLISDEHSSPLDSASYNNRGDGSYPYLMNENALEHRMQHFHSAIPNMHDSVSSGKLIASNNYNVGANVITPNDMSINQCSNEGLESTLSDRSADSNIMILPNGSSNFHNSQLAVQNHVVFSQQAVHRMGDSCQLFGFNSNGGSVPYPVNNQHIMPSQQVDNVAGSCPLDGNEEQSHEGHLLLASRREGSPRRQLPMSVLPVEGEVMVVNSVPHRLVRTPDGMVLAMLAQQPPIHEAIPVNQDDSKSEVLIVRDKVFESNVSDSCVQSDANVNGNGAQPGVLNVVSEPFPMCHEHTSSVVVPFGWRRIINGSMVFYISPSGAILGAMEQLREYLQTAGTCKCGLECPLLAEQAFNFDPKVPSKPYEMQSESTRDLTKLCNHKRKLLAMVSASLTQQQQGTAPTLDSPRKASETAKKKKKVTSYSGVSVSQLLAQKEKLQQQQCGQLQQQSVGERIWPSDDNTADPNRTASPTVPLMRPNNQSVPTNLSHSSPILTPTNLLPSPMVHNIQSRDTNFTPSNDISNKQNMGSHFITVNGGMLFNNSESQQKISQTSTIIKNDLSMNNIPSNLPNNNNNNNNNTNVINHVIGPHGQIIGVHTNISRNMINNPTDNKIFLTATSTSGFVSNKSDKNSNSASIQSEEKSFSNINQNSSIQQSNCSNSNTDCAIQSNNSQTTNVLIGPNPQSLTPEVVQRINQQQQMFIQQNQKQIEMAMKGIRTQFFSHNQVNNQTMKQKQNSLSNLNSQPMHQGQLIVQNGTVMMANQQSKTPPWQINKLNDNQNNSVQNQAKITSKPMCQQESQMICQNMAMHNMSVQQNLNGNYSINNFSNQGHHNVYSRVPPIHQHCIQPIWNEEVCKKKKASKSSKKARQNNNESSSAVGNTCSNINITQMGQNRNGYNISNINSKSPSFMEDPSGYLAQQTALLNSTISRQMEVHSNITNNNTTLNNTVNCQMNNQLFNQETNLHKNQNIRNNPNAIDHQSITISQRNQNFMSSNRPPPQCYTPDSSNQNEKQIDIHMQNQYNSHQFKGCMMSMSNASKRGAPSSEIKLENIDGINRLNNNFNPKMGTKSESGSQPGTPSSTILEDNPVTSSTICDRPGSSFSQGFSDPRGPIQGGTISTSNGSPVETFQLPEPSPTPSNSSRNTDTPQSHNSGSANMSSGSFAMPSPAHSNQGSSRDSNPATPNSTQYTFNNNNPCSYFGSPNHQSNNISQAQAMFNNNVNLLPSNNNQSKILAECDNIPQTLVVSNMINSVRNVQISQQQGQSCNTVDDKKFGQSHTFSVFNQRMPSIHNQFNNHLINSGNASIVTTMASGHTVIRDTITSVLAGKAQTATTSITASSNLQYGRLAVNVGNPFSNQNDLPNSMPAVNMPSNYPIHIAGTIAQTMISKSPLEMVQSIVSSIKVTQPSTSPVTSQHLGNQNSNISSKVNSSQNVTTPQILMSSNGQLLVTGSGQDQVMPPPPPKGQVISPVPSIAANNLASSSGSVSQVLPSGVQQVINQPTVLVNTLPAPFVIQPQMMTVDGQMMPQNTVLPQLVTNNIISQGQAALETHSPGQLKPITQNIQRGALLSPDVGKKKNKKKKVQNHQPVGMLQLATQHSPGVILQQGTQQPTQQFSPQSFQVTPNQNVQTTPVLQALTIVPGKAGTPAHILMNGQPTAGNFSSQQIITNSQPPQQINLLQPVNLLNSTTSVVQNFPTFQQFIVPGLGSMVMTADGTLIQDTSGMPVQLQIQNVNGQNVLTPVQNQGILTAGNAGMVIRTPTGHSKIVQAQHSPGTQFLSPNSQIVVNNTGFNGQLSPLIANVSPNQSVTFSTSPQQVRSSNVPQDFIQCNQMGQTLMVPVPPHQMPATSTATQGNTTFVQQNTTIVQQQTTMVSNNQAQFQTQNVNGSGNILTNTGTSSLSIEPTLLLNQNGKPISCNNKNRSQTHIQSQLNQQIMSQNFSESSDMKRIVQYPQIINQFNVQNTIKSEQEVVHHSNQTQTVNLSGQQMISNNNLQNTNNQNHSFMINNFNERHSVSTQTLLNQQQNDKSPLRSVNYQQVSGPSPPDTTTHSPLGPLEGNSSSPSLPAVNRSAYVHGNHADTTTKSPEPNDSNTSAMVQCVSSSEPDCEKESSNWPSPQSDFIAGDSNCQKNQQTDNHCFNVDASTLQFSHHSAHVNPSSICQQNISMLQTSYYHRNNLKRKSEDIYSNNVKYGNEKVMRYSTDTQHGNIIEMDNYKNRPYQTAYDSKNNELHAKNIYQDAKNNQNKMDMSSLRPQNLHLIHGNETKDESSPNGETSEAGEQLEAGDLVWGPARGFPAWPGQLMSRQGPQRGRNAKALVRWFGWDRSLALVDSSSLKTLSEGLEAHHAARTKARKSRKLNAQLEKAIQEAMAELDKMSEGGKANLGRRFADRQPLRSDDSKMSADDVLTTTSGRRRSSKARGDGDGDGAVKPRRAARNAVGSRLVPVKIAPHPSGRGAAEAPGRLRSSQQR